jgi:hypothetical protein
MSKISDEEHAQLDKSLPIYISRTLVTDLDTDIQTAATILATVLRNASTIYSKKGQSLNETYFGLDACGKLLEERKEVLDLLKRAHRDMKYADVRNFRECYHLILD